MKKRQIRQKSSRSSSEEESNESNIVTKKKVNRTTITMAGSKKTVSGEENKMQFNYKSSGTAQTLVADTSTRTLDIDGADETKEIESETVITADDNGDINLYHGADGYKEFVNKKVANVTQMSASRIRAGPLKGPSNVRISCRIDYAPDICKDYKETGYCGYGDSCKFMHDRGDYKHGWQIDQDWEKEQRLLAKGEKAPSQDEWLIKEGEEEEKASDEELPFACFICRQDFKNPIQTKCGHYFCERCAIKHHSKSPKCHACGAVTNGVFLNAKDLVSKLKERQERMEQQAIEIRKKAGGFEEEEEEETAEI